MDLKPLRRLSRERNNAGAALYNLSVIFAHAKGVLCPTSQSRFRSTAPLKRGAIDKEISFRSNTRCCDKTSPPQSLPLSGEVARRRRDREVWPAPPAKASPDRRGGIERERRCRRGFATFPEIPETDKIPETPANATGIVTLIYPTRVCFTRVSRHKFVTFCWWGAQTLGGYIGQSLQEMADFG